MADDELTLDSALRLLSHAHRRALVDCLDGHDEPIAVADAAADVAEKAATDSKRHLSAEVVHQVYLTLYHTHVPKLSDDGIVEYNRNRETIRLTERGQQLATILRSLSEQPDRPMIT